MSEQNLEALQLANHVREQRAGLKQRIHDGEVSVTEVLADPPDYVATMKVEKLLGAQKSWGTWRVCQAIALAGYSRERTIGSLTERERINAAEAVGRRAVRSQQRIR